MKRRREGGGAAGSTATQTHHLAIRCAVGDTVTGKLQPRFGATDGYLGNLEG
jgi:hypothetical protein